MSVKLIPLFERTNLNMRIVVYGICTPVHYPMPSAIATLYNLMPWTRSASLKIRVALHLVSGS